MIKIKYIILSYLLFLGFEGYAQKNVNRQNYSPAPDVPFLFNRAVCKGFEFRVIEKPQETISPLFIRGKTAPLLKVHGDISYDYSYRSRIDTPFQMDNFQQHAISVNLQMLYKDRIPFNISFSTRLSNSPFFRDYMDMGLHFDPQQYRYKIQREIAEYAMTKIPEFTRIDSLKRELESMLALVKNLKLRLNSSATIQELVEAKEKYLFHKRKEAKPAIEKDVHWNFMQDRWKEKPGSYKDSLHLAALQNEIINMQEKIRKGTDSAKAMRGKIEQAKLTLEEKKDSLKEAIYGSMNIKELKSLSGKKSIQPEDKWLWRLAAVKSFDIGSCQLDYSELTAKYITITGLQVEYNPSVYVAFAAGKINYLFRDFITRQPKPRGQYLAIGRFGLGNLEKNAVIFTVFKGAKSNSISAVPDSLQRAQDILGYAVELRFRPTQHTQFRIEAAKSTKPNVAHSQKGMNALVNYGDWSNAGIRLEGETFIEKTGTAINAKYKRTGENFQSFNYFSYHTNRTEWMARIDQPFANKKIVLTAMLRQNDFLNPFAEQTFKTTSVFKTFLLKVRFPKLPQLSVGYYPGTQYFMNDEKRLFQNAYYILNGTLNYSFTTARWGMNSMIYVNRYFNKATDTGFTYYQGNDYFASHTIYNRAFSVQGSYNLHDQPDMRFATLKIAGEFNIGNVLRLGAGLDYNQVKNGSSYIGQSASISATLGKIATVRAQYSKRFMPGFDNNLLPYEYGSIGVTKRF